MIAKSMENISIKSLREKLSTFYAEFGSDEQAIFMGEAMQRANGFNRYGIVETYSKFLKRCNNIQVIKTGLGYINNQAVKKANWYSNP